MAASGIKIAALAEHIGARLAWPGGGATIELEQVYAGDRVSDLLAAAHDHALLVSNLAPAQLVRVAELMDVPGLCLAGGQEPDADTLAKVRAHGTALLVSPVGLFETCGRIFAYLREQRNRG